MTYVLFCNGHGSCSGTLAYCKSAARRGTANTDNVYQWEIRDLDNVVLFRCVAKPKQRLVWHKTGNVGVRR